MLRLRYEASGLKYRPLVSILLPILEPQREWLQWGLDSVVSQVYPGWELCLCAANLTDEHVRKLLASYERLDERIEVTYPEGVTSVSGLLNAGLSLARGEFVGLFDYGDELTPDALFEVVRLLQECSEADLIYTDADEIDEKGNRSNPHFKPGWSPDLILSANYISHLSIYRSSLLREVGGFRDGFDGCHNYDLVLRATEHTKEIYHVPKVLYHRRAPANSPVVSNHGYTIESAHRALSETLERRGLEGTVEEGYLPNHFRIRLEIKGEPMVSIIIPTRDNAPLLKRCIESIERLTTYRNYELLIIDNDSQDSATIEYTNSIPHRVIPFREEFNYSRINNFGVSQAEGEYVLLLNDDTEVSSGEWLEAMLEHAQRPEVGAVGAKLIYPDGRIQHAGVIVGVGNPWGPGVAMHSHQFYSSDSPGYAGAIATTTNYSAVTAACMLLRKSLFEEIGGLDEENLRVQFNDVDLCLRIREQGYSIVYTPYAELYHHESVSRGHLRANAAENVYMRERWGAVLDREPYYNENFSKGHGDFNLRADLLRPKILRQEVEQAPTRAVSWLRNPWKHRRDVRARLKTLRSSSRTAIVPAPADGSAKYSRFRKVGHSRDHERQADIEANH